MMRGTAIKQHGIYAVLFCINRRKKPRAYAFSGGGGMIGPRAHIVGASRRGQGAEISVSGAHTVDMTAFSC